MLTAISNLKRQCYIFTDVALRILMTSMVLPCQKESVLYIVVRPSLSVWESSNFTSLTPTSGPAVGMGGGAVGMGGGMRAGVGSVYTTHTQGLATGAGPGVGVGGGLGGAHNMYDNWVMSKYDRKILLKGRELMFGVRLVFYELDMTDVPDQQQQEEEEEGGYVYSDGRDTNKLYTGEDSNSSDVSREGQAQSKESITYDVTTLKKLFETTLSFKVTVGISHLRCRPSFPTLNYVLIPPLPSASGLYRTLEGGIPHVTKKEEEELMLYVYDEFQIENISLTLPLTYQYLTVHDNLRILMESIDFDPPTTPHINMTDFTGILLVIHDNICGTLLPGQIKIVKYTFIAHRGTSGLSIQHVRLLNKNTGDEKNITLSAYFNKNHLQHHTLSFPLPTTNTITTSTAHIPTPPLINTPTLHPTPAESALPRVEFESPIWIHPHKSTPSSSSTLPQSSATSASVITSYQVIGSRSKLLGEWYVYNASTSSLMVTPVSDLPFTIQLNLENDQL